VLVLAACDRAVDTPPTAASVAIAANAGADDDVPPRGADTKLPTWNAASDSALWAQGVSLDTLFVVGLKSPGRARGFYQNRRLIAERDWQGGRRALAVRAGVRVVTVDSALPLVRVKIADLATLARMRQLPFVDYLEPALLPGTDLGELVDGGCDFPADATSHPRDAYGDYLPQSYSASKVNRAWAYGATGAGEWIGLVDTGTDRRVDFTTDWATGESAGRQPFRQTTQVVVGTAPGSCSHGTRMAGVLAAPRNRYGVQGVAWKANLYSVHFSNWVYEMSGVDAFSAIRDAGNFGSRIITMAWSVGSNYAAISDEIDRLYYRNVVFVAAAGTSPADVPGKGNVLFPAEKWNVLAVSAADFSGYRDNQSH